MLAGEVEVVREPALADQEMYELLGGRDVLAVFKDRGAVERSLDGERLAMGAGGPSGRRLRRLRKLQTHSRSARSRIERPASISLSVAVSGGAIRHTLASPGSETMFIDRPSSRQRRVILPPSSG
jgi:hypothetical protein